MAGTLLLTALALNFGTWSPVYAATTPGEDCDANGVIDAQEIRTDRTLDWNENGSLDICEQAAGDLDLSESVDFGDICLVLLELGTTAAPADVNHDGTVDFQDVALVTLEFGPTPRSSVPRRMLSDLLERRSHVDVVVIGDSNATFSQDDSRGYSNGFFDELSRRGIPLYATGLLPTALSGTGTAYPLMGLTGEGTSAASSVTVNDAPRPQDGWMRASVSGGSLPDFRLGAQTAPLQLEGREVDWAFLPEDADPNGHEPEWIGLARRAPGSAQFGSQCSGALRLLIARFPGSRPNEQRAPLRLRISEQSPTWRDVLPPVEVPTGPAGSPGITACEAHYPADPQRGTLLGWHQAADASSGPLGILLRSLYRTDGVPGYAINVLRNFAGGTSGEIALSLDDDAGCGLPTLQTYLRELRERQRAAGGPGRVLVFVNMGINNGRAAAEQPAEEACADDAVRIVAQLDRAWSSLGYPDSDLGFVITASHDGAVDGYRADLASDLLHRALEGSRRISILDVDALAPRQFLSANRMFAGNEAPPDAHLSREGYRAIVERLIERLRIGMGYRPHPPGSPSS
jgi:hypothetical protein